MKYISAWEANRFHEEIQKEWLKEYVRKACKIIKKVSLQGGDHVKFVPDFGDNSIMWLRVEAALKGLGYQIGRVLVMSGDKVKKTMMWVGWSAKHS